MKRRLLVTITLLAMAFSASAIIYSLSSRPSATPGALSADPDAADQSNGLPDARHPAERLGPGLAEQIRTARRRLLDSGAAAKMDGESPLLQLNGSDAVTIIRMDAEGLSMLVADREGFPELFALLDECGLRADRGWGYDSLRWQADLHVEQIGTPRCIALDLLLLPLAGTVPTRYDWIYTYEVETCALGRLVTQDAHFVSYHGSRDSGPHVSFRVCGQFWTPEDGPRETLFSVEGQEPFLRVVLAPRG